MPERTFSARLERGMCWFWCGLFLVFALGAAFTYAHSKPGAAVGYTVICVAAAELWGWIALRWGVTTGPDGIVSRRVRTTFLGWDEIESFANSDRIDWVLPSGIVVARLKNGGTAKLAIASRRQDLLATLRADLEASRQADR